MLTWVSRRARALRTWLLVRFGPGRRQWRRGRIEVPGARSLFGQIPVDTWPYGLYSPAGMGDGESAPLIVVLHGCRQRALGFAYASGWTDFANRSRVRLLCPDQRRLANLFRCWNWFHSAAQRGRGELDVITAMIDDVIKRVRVETNAIAAVGMSAGGALAALLAFHFPDRFRAVVTVAAPPLLGTPTVQNPHAIMRRGLAFSPLHALSSTNKGCAPLAIIHGTADKVVHPRCAEQLTAQAIESNRRAGMQTVKADTTQASAIASLTDYRADGNLRVRNIAVKDLGHIWTGGPGGHPYCESQGAPLAALCVQFLRDVGMIRR